MRSISKRALSERGERRQGEGLRRQKDGWTDGRENPLLFYPSLALLPWQLAVNQSHAWTASARLQNRACSGSRNHLSVIASSRHTPNKGCSMDSGLDSGENPLQPQLNFSHVFLFVSLSGLVDGRPGCVSWSLFILVCCVIVKMDR